MSPDGRNPPERRGAGAVAIPDDATILRWLAVPPVDRLRWLEEANRFLAAAQPPEVRRIWQAFRRGEA